MSNTNVGDLAKQWPKVLLLEYSYKHSDFELVDIFNIPESFNELKLYDILKEKIDRQKMTFVDEDTLYSFDNVAFQKILTILRSKSNGPGSLYLNDLLPQEIENKYLFPQSFRITISTVTNI